LFGANAHCVCCVEVGRIVDAVSAGIKGPNATSPLASLAQALRLGATKTNQKKCSLMLFLTPALFFGREFNIAATADAILRWDLLV